MLEIEAEKIDENPAGIFERFRPGSIHRRYFEVLGQLMSELAARGDVLLVGRGGSCFLCGHPGAFHVRLVAAMPIRVRRVMEYRWLAEALVASSSRKATTADAVSTMTTSRWTGPIRWDTT